MTKELPPNADFEWLRKAAKSLLKSWRATGRDAKLADAQYSLAQDYSFASWRALKAHFAERWDNDAADAFLLAVGQGDLAKVQSDLHNAPDLKNCVGNHPFWGGRPHPLHVAIDTNREDVFDLLLAAGADVEGRGADYDNWTPLMLALSQSRSSMVAKLRAKGAQEGLCVALLDGNDAALDQQLRLTEWRSWDLPSGSLLGLARTPHAVHALIEAGVSPNGKDRWGSDALDALSRLGDKGAEVVAALAEHGATPSAETLARLGDQAGLEKQLAHDPSLISDPSVITAAVDFGRVEMAQWLLAKGADVNARQQFGSGGTALHSAAWNGDLAMVRCLLENGADTSALDEEYNTTPFVWAKTARKVTNNPDCENIATLLQQVD